MACRVRMGQWWWRLTTKTWLAASYLVTFPPKIFFRELFRVSLFIEKWTTIHSNRFHIFNTHDLHRIRSRRRWREDNFYYRAHWLTLLPRRRCWWLDRCKRKSFTKSGMEELCTRGGRVTYHSIVVTTAELALIAREENIVKWTVFGRDRGQRIKVTVPRFFFKNKHYLNGTEIDNYYYSTIPNESANKYN